MPCVAPLSDTAIQTVTDMQRLHPSRRARRRAHGLLLSHQGFSMRRIAAVYQVSRYAVAEWLERWPSAGLVGLDDHPRSGRPPSLTPDEQHKVDPYLQEHPKDVTQVGHVLEQATHKRVSTTTITRLIKKNHIPSNLVVERVTAHRNPPEVRIWRLRNQSCVGTVPPSTSTPHCPACWARR
jgi:transposase